MKALVTGGAGFIGSHLVDGLLADGWQVVVLDNLSTGRLANLAHLAHERRLTFVEGDVCDAGLVARLVRGCQVVYHLAALVGVRYVLDNPIGGIHTNVYGTENVLAAAARHGARVCFASTSELYGQNSAVPFAEDAARVLGPTWVARWSYATAKALGEHLCFAYRERGLDVAIVRYFNAYGPRLHPAGYGSVIARFIGQALAGEPLTVHGDGRQSRAFTYVADSVRGTMLAGTERAALGQAFNIGGETETSIVELARTIVALTGSSSTLSFQPYEVAYGPSFADPQRRLPDVSKARCLLGFSARVPLAEGLARTIAWFRGL